MGSRTRRILRILARSVAYGGAAILVLGAAAFLYVESSWGKERLRQLIVSQAGRILTGRLEIDRVDGSLLRGINLEGVRLYQDGIPVVTIDGASVAYSIRELYESGTSIRQLTLTGLHVVGAQSADGRWNLASLVRPRAPRAPGQPPGRLITFQQIEIADGTVEFRSPLTLGAAHVPSRLEHLQATLAFELRSPAWSLSIAQATWRGRAPDLQVNRLSGGLATDETGWSFEKLRVETPLSQFSVTGHLVRTPAPTNLDLSVVADRFAFQEWSGVLTGLRNIAVESAFTASLKGPLDRLVTDIDLRSNAGAVRGALTLNSTVPGWHGAGTADVNRLDLSRWLNQPTRHSNITGHVGFDLDLQLGQHFPVGTYTFTGPHAGYLGYEADQVNARGHITHDEAIIAMATATAYGANVRVTAGAIGIDDPFRFRFAGRADGVDLRRLPPDIPVPHVESTLTLDYDVTGQFAGGVLTGRAAFDESEFLGAQVRRGATGAIDTSVTPFTYSGSGELSDVRLRRFGEDLDIEWMREPRYDGVVAGQFHVEGAGADLDTMTLRGGGRLRHAELFDGTLGEADVDVEIANGSLTGHYDGRFERINPVRAFDDPRLAASLSGSGRFAVAVRDVLLRTTTVDDYAIEATATLGPSTVRTVALDQSELTATLKDNHLTVERISVAGPAVAATGHGVVAVDTSDDSRFDYDVTRLDLSIASEALGRTTTGVASSVGRMTGSATAPHLTGSARVLRVISGTLEMLSGAFDYDATVPVDDPQQTTGRLSGTFGPMTIGDQAISEVTAAITTEREQVTLDLRGTRSGGLNAALILAGQLHLDDRALDVTRMALTVQNVPWQLSPAAAPHLAWDDAGVTVRDLALTDQESGRQRLAVSGTWRYDGSGVLRVVAAGVFIDSFSGAFAQPARYGGRLDADATIRGTNGAGATIVTGTFTISDGRVRRLPFNLLTARIDYRDGLFDIDARLDQAPGVFLTAVGTVPLGVVVDGQPDLPMNVAIKSSPIDVGILEGVTDVVHEVSGQMQLDVTAVGTGQDPHFAGTVEISNAGFAVRTTGSRYKNGRLSVSLATDRVSVQALHLEDSRGRTLDVTGSLGTHEMRVGDVEITATARQFEVVRNEFGNVEVDASLNLRGQFESPKLTGTITISGGQLNVDEILDRTLLQPYSTEAAAPATGELDALVVLNPWERLGLDLTVHTRGTLRMIGENVQVTPGTTLGLGNVNIRAFGEVYLYKDPAQPLSITGSLDSLIGTYAFQGRRFDLDPISSVVFRGDLNPELYVTVTRDISGVETRVAIVGPLNEPELRLSSTPPLDDSDILSLIVFNTSINQLSAAQQQELAYRAGTLAAGFLTAPLLSALEKSIGLDILEIEPPSDGATGPRVTVGDELAPGLIARFSRQFGQEEYNEASIEYFLSRLFRIRATFSDAGNVLTRSPFRRVERAGIDLLLFLSF